MFDQSKVGQSFPPFSFAVERGKIHELALALGDGNPIYQSQEAAQAAGYADVPLFPTFPTILAFWGNTRKMEQLASLGIAVQHILHGQEAYTYLASILPGDVLTGVMTLTTARTTQSRNGSFMDILTFETGYVNQYGTTVLNAREVILVRS